MASHMREDRAIWRLAGTLSTVRGQVDELDSSLNANRVAQYEMHYAMRTLQAFAQSGDQAAIALARERFNRVLVMLTPNDRRKLGPQVNRIIDTAEQLTEPERRTLAADWGKQYSAAASEVTVLPSSEEIIGDEIEFIRRVMKGLENGLDRWTWEVPAGTRTRAGRQWHIDNEIHVQNLLWLALAPALPDLKYEETLPSVGATHPRTDLALPRLHLAIEAKFMRRPADERRVTAEIAADSALYTAAHDSHYSRLMVLVWDDSRSTQCHHRIETALKTFRGVVDAVVVSRPGNMVHEDHH